MTARGGVSVGVLNLGVIVNRSIKFVSALVAVQASVLILFWGSPLVAISLVVAPLALALAITTMVIATSDSTNLKTAVPGATLVLIALSLFVTGYVSIFAT